MVLDRPRKLSNATTNRKGHRRLGASLGTLASFIVLLLASSSASAATLNVSDGELLGASGVIVDGISYSVEFLNGTCVALYNGCDAVSDFTFQSHADALLAAQALLDQVFLDGAELFDTDPELTAGCTSFSVCFAETPWDIVGLFGGTVLSVSAVNDEFEISDATDDFGFDVDADTTADIFTVFAVWAVDPPVPGVPSLGPIGTAALVSLLGLAGLGWRGRAKHG